MIDTLDDLQYRIKRLANNDRLVMATVRPNESAQAVASPENPEARDLLARAMGYVDICARKNAEAVSSNPLVLYRPRSGRTRGRAVSRRAAKYLSGELGIARTKQNVQIAAEDDDFEIVDVHESIVIMDRPNRWVRSSTDFRFAQQYAKELTGNSYAAWVAGENAMYTLNPQFVSVIPDEDGDELIGSYTYGRDTAAAMELFPDEILHGTLYTDFRQPYYGVSWLNAIIDTADLWIATEAYLRKTMRSSGRPDILLHFEGQYSPEQFNQTKRNFYARVRDIMRGGRRSEDKGNIIVTGEHEGRPTAIPLGTPPKDMASVEIANDAERTIGNAAGIPETVYRMSESNLASARTGEMVWKRDTIMPRCVREAEEMTEWLHANFPEAKDGEWFFAPENCVPADREADERVAIGGWQSGLIRRNEARTVLGYDPIEGDEGEVFFADTQPKQEAGSDPLAALFGTRPAQAAQQPQTREALPEAVKAHDPGDEDDAKPVEPKQPDKPAPCGCGTKSGTPWLASKAWKDALAVDEAPDLGDQVERSRESALKLVNAYNDVFERMRDEIIGLTEAAPMGLKGANPRRYRTKDAIGDILRAWGIAQPGKWADSLFEDTQPLIEDEFYIVAGEQIEAIRAGASSEVAESIPTGDPRDMVLQSDRGAQAAAKFADRYRRDMDQVIATLADDLARNISEGLEQGESLRQIQDRILNLYNAESEGVAGTMSQRRAATIARTEVSRASTDGRIAGMAGSNVVKGYEFIRAASACPVCSAVEAETRGKVFGLGEPIFPKGSSIVTASGSQFKFDYDDTIVPIHPNCRCGVQAVLVDM